MAGFGRVHWVPPVGMIAGLCVGSLLAIGHHLFYSSLHGTRAPTGTFRVVGANVSRQQLNTAVGTAFGFIVKSFLTLTVSIAFVQTFWRAARSSRKGHTLPSLDRTFSLLTNVVNLFKLEVWRNFQLPLLLAFIAWCVPIASIITPATLSVESTAIIPAPVGPAKVPNVDFTSLDYVAQMPEGSSGYCFNGASQSVQRIVAATSSLGQILPIKPPEANVTWTHDFWGPSLHCEEIQSPERDSTLHQILDGWTSIGDCMNAYGYLAWLGSPNSSMPFVRSKLNDGAASLTSATMVYGAPMSLYLAIIPQMFNFAFVKSDSATQERCTFYGRNSLMYTYPIADDMCLPSLSPPICYGQKAWLVDAKLLRCDLMNSSYHTVYKYIDGAQHVNVTIDRNHSSVPVTPRECFQDLDSINETASRLLSYQGLAHAFSQLLLGSITTGGYGMPVGGEPVGDNTASVTKTPGIIMNSSISTTVLMATKEMAFISEFNGVNETFPNLQMQVAQSNNPALQGLSKHVPTGRRGDLRSAVEMLFQNITISLLAEESLQPNYSSPYAPEKLTEVTYNRYHNIYVYSSRTLWAAYGVAILFTLVALCVGIESILSSKASFSGDFSTILRTVRMAPMNEEIREVDCDGRQPLPEHLARARIVLGSYVREEKGPEAAPSANTEEDSGNSAHTSADTHLLTEGT